MTNHLGCVLLCCAATMTFTYTFSLDAPTIIENPTELARFTSELQRAFLAGAVEAWTDGPDLADSLGALRLAHVSVSNIRPSSSNNLVADVTLVPPPNTSTEQLAQLSLLSPADLILGSSGLRKELVSSERLMPSTNSASRGSRKIFGGDAIIGVVIGCVGVLAAMLAATVVVIRRRRTVHASISHCSSDDSEAQARCALSTAGGAPSTASDHHAVTVTSSNATGADLSKLAEAASLAAAAASALKNCGSEPGSATTCNGEAARLAEAAAAALASASSVKDDVKK